MMYGYLAEYYERGHGQPTRITAARVFGTSVLSAAGRRPHLRAHLRPGRLSRCASTVGSWESRNYITVGAGTVAQAGLGFRPFYRASETDERFHLLAIKGSPACSSPVDLPSVWLGRGMRPETAYETTTAWAELRVHGDPSDISSTGTFSWQALACDCSEVRFSGSSAFDLRWH